MIESNKKISLIIPTHNRVESLQVITPSLLTQKELKEIIFIDDSTDKKSKVFLGQLAKENNIIKLITLEKRVGLAAARNIAIKKSSGDYIMFGDDDVIYEENYSKQLLSCLQKTDADIISGRIIYLNEGESKADALLRADKETLPIINKKLLTLRAWKKTLDDEKIIFTHACILVRREVFDSCLFDESMSNNGFREDTDFQIQAAKKGYKIYFCPHTQLYHLPREKIKGGCGFAEMNPWLFVFYRMKNNYTFLKKHYKYIKSEMSLKYGFIQMLFFLLIDENLRFLGSKAIRSLLRRKK